jgi:ABC-type lipoprotein export system ATPase subunit
MFSYGSEWRKWDLHVHTASSYDYKYKGTDSDELLANAWKKHDIKAVAITDHSKIDFNRITHLKSLAPEVTIFPGFELRTDKGAPNVHIIGIFSEKVDVKILSQDFDSLLIRNKVRPGENDETLIRDFNDIVKFTREHKGLLSIHAGSKDKSIDKEITNAIPQGIAIKTDIASQIDIFEIGQVKDIIVYKKDVFKSIKQRPLILCSDNHNPKEYNVKEYLWIKADTTFDGLKQITYDPDERVSIDSNNPYNTKLNCLTNIQINGNYWFSDKPLVFNKGLISIIGSRGSGKTALLDIISVVLNAYDYGRASFLRKAKNDINQLDINYTFSESGEKNIVFKNGFANEGIANAKYLSQQYVESLCSDTGASEDLLNEIERFVFNEIPDYDRYGKVNFRELKEYLCSTYDQHIDELRHSIIMCSKEIAKIRLLKNKILPSKELKRKELLVEIANIRGKLPKVNTSNKDSIINKISEINKQGANLAVKIKKMKEDREEFISIIETIKKINIYLSGNIAKILAQLEKYKLSESEKKIFAVSIPSKAFEMLDGKLLALDDQIKKEMGDIVEPDANTLNWYKNQRNILNENLSGISLTEQNLIRLNENLNEKENELKLLDEEIKNIKVMSIIESNNKRKECYKQIFEEINKKTKSLMELYKPLESTFQNTSPDYQPLSFYLKTTVEIEKWAKRGEDLIDLRRYTERESLIENGSRVKKGTLLEVAKQYFSNAWESCDPEKCAKAMEAFHDESLLLSDILSSSVTKEDFANWLYSTDHIKITYNIKYDGRSIEQLSPGMKGIVLLILYLKLDKNDNKPLLIDQPEDNLDPASVYEKLVPYFRETKKRRQIIMVTHNPNLVVGTDSEQVIIAESHIQSNRKIPIFKYTAGSLENEKIKEKVCAILEGGKEAFERRRKYYDLQNI